MIPLQTTQWMLTLFGLLQNENLPTWQKFANALFSLINLVLTVIQITASVVFAVEFLMVDLERTLMAMAQILSWTPLMYMLLVTLLLRRKITELIEEVTTIFNSSMYFLYVLIQKLFTKIQINRNVFRLLSERAKDSASTNSDITAEKNPAARGTKPKQIPIFQ